MAFLEWLEATSLAEWARISVSGYPTAIGAHSVGLAVMVGPILMLDLRLLGWFSNIPYSTFVRILKVAWAGFVLNFLSGVVLFTMSATTYISNTQFLLKMALVLLGAITAAQQHASLARNGAAWNTSGVPASVSKIAIVSIVFWVGAIITGRLIAYL